MINTSIVEEMLEQLELNQVFRNRLLIRLRIETSTMKREKFKEEMNQALSAIRELTEMLEYEYAEGITTGQLLKDIQR